MADTPILTKPRSAGGSSADTATMTRYREVVNQAGCSKVSKLSPKGIARVTIIPYCGKDGGEPMQFEISCQDLAGAISIDRQPEMTEIESQCVGASEMIFEDYKVEITITLRYNRWLENANLLAATYGSTLATVTDGGQTYSARGISLNDLLQSPRYYYVEIQPTEAVGIDYTTVFPAVQIAQSTSGSISFGKTDERTIELKMTAVVPPEEFRVAGNPLSQAIEYTLIPVAA